MGKVYDIEQRRLRAAWRYTKEAVETLGDPSMTAYILAKEAERKLSEAIDAYEMRGKYSKEKNV